jgi:hypothetical protein
VSAFALFVAGGTATAVSVTDSLARRYTVAAATINDMPTSAMTGIAHRRNCGLIFCPETSDAALRTRSRSTLRVSQLYAPSKARSQMTLMTRGTPPDKRKISFFAPGSNISVSAPATFRR